MRKSSCRAMWSWLLGLLVLGLGSQAIGEELSLALSKSARQGLEKIAEQLRQGGPDFVAWPASVKTERHQRLHEAMEDLEVLLKRSGEDREQGWKQYLRWEAVQEQMSADEPDVRKLQPVLSQFYRNENGLEMNQFTGVRDTLRDYMNALVFEDAERATKTHAAQLAELGKRLDAYLKQPNGEDAWAIGRGLGWLTRSNQAPEMQTRLHALFGHDNLVLQASRRFVEISGSSEVVDTTDITDYILGTSIKGVAETKGKITLDAKTLHVDNPVMREHMLDKGWMDVAKHPKIEFVAEKFTNVKTSGTKTSAKVEGKFSVKGVTRKITVPVTLTYLKGMLAKRNRVPGDLLVLRADFTIKRSDYNINPGDREEKVSDEIEIKLRVAGAAPQGK